MAIQRDKIVANAEKLVAKGKIEPAIKEYETLLDDNPNDVNTLNRVGDLWVRINRTDEAVKAFGAIAHHYSKDGFFLKAIAIYKKINKLDPSKLDVYDKLADLYAKQGLASEAKSQFQVLADYYLKHGDPGNALTTYRKMVELDPNDMKAHVKLADLYSANGQTAEGLKEYDRVGRMLLKRGMLDEAVQVFKKALKIDAKNVELVESLVTALVDAKDLNNAQQIVETALGMNPDHPRLVAAWGRILIAKGDVSSAKSGLEKAIQSHPDELAPREVLGDLYLRQNYADKALEMLAPVAEGAMKRGEKTHAVDVMNRILKVDKAHTPTLEKLVAIYQRANEETNILASMNTLAEAHIARGEYQQASSVLEKLIQREPQNAQHRTKLDFVKSQTGGGAAPAPRAKPTSPPPNMEIEEPLPVLDFDESPAVELDASPAIELDLGGASEGASAPPPPRIEQASPAMEVEPANDDLDFITEHLTEAEVFAKYGLIEKATEHLRAVIERSPRHLPAHEKLYKILLDEGETDAARDAAMQYVGLLQEEGNRSAIGAVKNDFLTHGLTLAIAGEAEEEPSMAELEAEPPLPAAAAVEEETELTLEPEPEPEMEIEVGVEEEAPSLSFDDTPSAEAFFGTEAAKEVEIEPEPEPEPEPELELEPEPEPEPEMEIEPEPAPTPAAEHAELHADDLQSELLSALPEEDFEPTPAPPPVAQAPPPTPAPVLTSAQEENLFAEEDNFFDLASELESELAEETESISLNEEEQSLEEIFKEFKKGVEQQLEPEDYDTHYNLGIAYKEMGLIDEAIGEFQLASKDPKRAVECASMLGLCFMEKGMPQLAIKWYRKGLELPEITDEEHLGMLYDLGGAFMESGDADNAQKTFMEVYGLNTGYRDVASRIKQLEDASK